MIEGYVKREERKKILMLGDDIRWTSGIATVLREIVIGTAHKYNWIQLAGSIQHPDKGKKLDLNEDTNKHTGLTDASVYLYPVDGYGSPEIVRSIIQMEKPDALFFMTDPRYYIWLFQMEHEIRQKIPMIYLNIWDDLPYPYYNRAYYESCDTLIAISKQTENINRVVLKNRDEDKIIRYIPHGINEKQFYPISIDMPEYLALQTFEANLFKGKQYKFKLLFNARNIRRKSIPDLMLAWKLFIDDIGEEAKDCILILHTQVIDQNGTDLEAVKEMLFGNNLKYNIFFHDQRSPVQVMNLLYNLSDATILPSSNEGWGLSLTESMLTGKPIIATVTGGMQDQMRFEDETGKWIDFTEEFGSNHSKKYLDCGKWAFPIFPNNRSLIGSVPTPYIFDDRCSPDDIKRQISTAYNVKIHHPAEWAQKCKSAREWVLSDESKMTSAAMCKSVIAVTEETFEKFKPRHSWELIETEISDQPKHYNSYVYI